MSIGIAKLAFALLTLTATPPAWEYRYRCVATRIVDGDTLDTGLEIAPDIVHQGVRVRLYGIDTPETYGRTSKAGKAASEAATRWIAERQGSEATPLVRGRWTLGPPTLAEWPLRCSFTGEEDSFGRWLGYVSDVGGEDLGRYLLESGHAEVWDD